MPRNANGRIASRIARVANIIGLRAAKKAASMTSRADPGSPARSADRRRTASRSLITSSITKPTAAARPSSVIVVKVVPDRYST